MLVSGIDMIEVDRIERSMIRYGERFYRRFFTEQERNYCENQAARLAGRFAVKEAVAKALGTGVGDFNWTDIEVVCDGRGRPELVLHNNAQVVAQDKGLTVWSISLSHTETHAIGMAIALGSSLQTPD